MTKCDYKKYILYDFPVDIFKTRFAKKTLTVPTQQPQPAPNKTCEKWILLSFRSSTATKLPFSYSPSIRRHAIFLACGWICPTISTLRFYIYQHALRNISGKAPFLENVTLIWNISVLKVIAFLKFVGGVSLSQPWINYMYFYFRVANIYTCKFIYLYAPKSNASYTHLYKTHTVQLRQRFIVLGK